MLLKASLRTPPRRIQALWLLCIVFLCLFSQCHPEATGGMAKRYHNTTANFNGYFLSKNLITEIEATLFQDRKDNYNRILHVWPVLDTNQLKGLQKKTDEAVRRAAFAIERHPKSDWVGDCYVLVGKARFYLRDYASAITTFKYVNTQIQKEEARQAALIELMRVYIHQKDYDNAELVKNLLIKEGVSKQNLSLFYYTQSHYYRERNDFALTLKSLDLLLPLLSKGEVRGRLYFLKGQLLQKNNSSAEAYKMYKKVLRNNPNYELALQSRLAMLKNSDSTRKPGTMRKTYQKMLRDEKNKDYLDKVYYDFALYEIKKNNLPQGIRYLRNATQVSKNNPGQKGLAFLKLGELYFDVLQEYELAKTYYDSTIQFLPKDEENYQKIAKRQQVLGDFVKQIQTIRLEDSLQRMGKMSSEDLSAFLDKNINENLLRQEALEAEAAKERAKNEAKSQKTTGTLAEAVSTQQGATWYFDNPSVVAQGKREFIKKWGNRPLSDHWRIRSRAAQLPPDPNSEEASLDLLAEQSPEALRKAQVAEIKKEVMEAIPRSAEQLTASHKKVEEAVYQLGKIYHFQLEEYPDAYKSYEDLLRRYPVTGYEPEVLYLLYLAAKEMKNEAAMRQHAILAQTKYPNAVYTKLIINPNFLSENKANEEQAAKLYEEAYKHFERRKYEQAVAVLSQLEGQYPNSSLQDRVAFLKILSLRNSLSPALYKESLNNFAKAYPESELKEYAEKLYKDLAPEDAPVPLTPQKSNTAPK